VHRLAARHVLAYVLLTLTLVVVIASAPAGGTAKAPPALDLESLTGLEAEAMMAAGELTSVERWSQAFDEWGSSRV